MASKNVVIDEPLQRRQPHVENSSSSSSSSHDDIVVTDDNHQPAAAAASAQIAIFIQLLLDMCSLDRWPPLHLLRLLYHCCQ